MGDRQRDQPDIASSPAVSSATLINQLEMLLSNMASEMAAIQVERQEFSSLAEARLSIIYEQARSMEEARLASQMHLEKVEALESRAIELQLISDERLQVIQELQSRADALQRVCDERLQVIQELQSRADGLQRTCDERLVVIQELQSRADALQRVCDERLDVIVALDQAARGQVDDNSVVRVEG